MNVFYTDKTLKSKNFWDARPCNIRHSKKEFCSREYFDEVERKRYFVEPHNYEFAEFYKWKEKKVLELGCGLGTDTINFARAGAMVDAVDFSPKSIEIARKRAELFDVSVIFHQCSFEHIHKHIKPWSKQYDLIYSFGVIHHTEDPNQIFQKLYYYSHNKTVIKLMLYHKWSTKVLRILTQNFYKLSFKEIKDIISDNAEAQFGCPIAHVYTKNDVVKMLSKHGIAVTSIKIKHIFPYIIKYYKNNIYKKSWYYRYMSDKFFNWLQKNFGWHLLVEAKIVR